MLINEKQQEFLEKRVIDGKSLETISAEIDVPVSTLREWGITLMEKIEEIKFNEIDRLLEEHQLTKLKRLKYLADLHTRLRKELDNRDFSGLPTDKLYHILNDVYQEFDTNIHYEEEEDWDDDDDFNDWDDLD